MRYVDGYVLAVPKKSRAHRDRVNAKVMKDMARIGAPKEMPFEVKRMVYGGFEVLVSP